MPTQPVTLTLVGSAIAPPGLPPLHIELHAAGAKRATWRIEAGDTRTFQVALPADAIGPGGLVLIELRIANPGAPRDVFPNSTDARRLGLYVRSVGLAP